ncbi:MAG: hypothetical protein ACWGOV_04335 [Acidiferrobacterales bacterium]
MKTRNLFLTLILATSVTSCGIANNLTEDTFSKISSVSVSKEITGAKYASYYGAAENAAFALGGVVGAVASGDSNMSKGQMLTLALKKNNINVQAKYYKRFLQQVGDNPLFKGKLVRFDSGENAVFHLEVYKYGLYASGPFSSKMEPEVGIRATLIDKQGNKLWTNFAYVSALNFSGYEYTLEQYMKDPAKLNAAYDAALDKAVKTLIGKLKLAMLKGEIRQA